MIPTQANASHVKETPKVGDASSANLVTSVTRQKDVNFAAVKASVRKIMNATEKVDSVTAKVTMTAINAMNARCVPFCFDKKKLNQENENLLKITFFFLQFGFANISLGCVPCDCNASGSIEHFCETSTGQCPCKMGVEGLRCDECEEGFYGLSDDGCQGKLNLLIGSYIAN